MPDGFDVAVRWAAALTEPLLSTAARVAADDAMRGRAAADPEWAATLFGGVLADVLTTLPPDDPWRHLSARIGGIEHRHPAGRGARHRGVAAGPRRRLAPVRHLAGRRRPDRAGPGRRRPAGRPGGRGAGRTRSDRRPRRSWRSPPAAAPNPAPRWPPLGPDGAAVFEAGADALRWAVHRRRAYRGPGDLWPVEALTEWAAAAENRRPGGPAGPGPGADPGRQLPGTGRRLSAPTRAVSGVGRTFRRRDVSLNVTPEHVDRINMSQQDMLPTMIGRSALRFVKRKILIGRSIQVLMVRRCGRKREWGPCK